MSVPQGILSLRPSSLSSSTAPLCSSLTSPHRCSVPRTRRRPATSLFPPRRGSRTSSLFVTSVELNSGYSESNLKIEGSDTLLYKHN